MADGPEPDRCWMQCHGTYFSPNDYRSHDGWSLSYDKFMARWTIADSSNGLPYPGGRNSQLGKGEDDRAQAWADLVLGPPRRTGLG